MICMSRKQAKLEKLSIELIRFYFEEHDFELLKEYLSNEISMMGEHRSALCHGMQEVERALQEVSIIYGEMVHLQDVYCEIIYQKQDIAVVAYTCIQHAHGSGLLCRLKVSLVWEMEAGGWKIRHIHQSLSDDATERENSGIHHNAAKLPVYNQHCDTLTQIFNLEGFVEAARELLQHTNQQYALFKFGISDFRFINQIHGYAFGDDVLKSIARNLQSFCQKDELCARIEKDTFAALLRFTSIDDFYNRLHCIRKHLLDEPIVSCLKHTLQYIGGVYLIQDACGESIKSMLDKAVLAMQYVERNSRVSDFVYFEDWMLDQKNRRSELLEEAIKAIQEDTFQLFIQPQFLLSDGSVVSGEALSRWFLKDGSCVSPDEFIPLFEKHGLISGFDFYVLHKLCKFMRTCLDEGKELLPISINQSRLHIKERQYLRRFCEIVDSYAIPHEKLVFELTESAFTDNANDLQVFMKDIHDAGFQIAIDDFGTGYAGIGMLSQVDADILKLDKGMLNGINTDRRQMTIFWKIIEMAHSIGMQVICEGIETREQYADLRMLRCDIGQEFLVSRAIAATEFAERYLR